MGVIQINIPENCTSDEARTQLLNSVYKASVQFYESIGEHGKLTDNKKLVGNGHHMAQELAQKAGEIWDKRITDK